MNRTINDPLKSRMSIPSGYVLGRTGAGSGPPMLIPIAGNFVSAGYVANTTIQVNGPAGGDLSGTYPNPTVAKIQGNAVKAGALGAGNDGQVLTWVNANSDWEATALPSTGVPQPPGLAELIDAWPVNLKFAAIAFVNPNLVGSLAASFIGY